MKLVLLSVVLCVAIYVASAMKLLASSSRALNSRETNLLKRLVKRQARNDVYCDRRACAVPNCGKDYIATTLQGECCERCVPWEYARSIGIPIPQGPQSLQDPRAQQRRPNDPYNQYPYNQPQQYQPERVDVYIFGPDEGARVSTGQSIYFDCEVVSSQSQYAQPRWSRSGNQPLPQKSQSTTLPGNRKLVRLTIPDATPSDAGRYECSAGTSGATNQASIDLQVTDGGYYPRPQPQPQPRPQPQPQPRPQPQPQPRPQPQPQYPQYDPYNQYQYNQPGYYPSQPQPQPQPQPRPQPQPQPNASDDGDDDGGDEDREPAAQTTTAAARPAPGGQPPAAAGGEDETEYPEDYSENEK